MFVQGAAKVFSAVALLGRAALGISGSPSNGSVGAPYSWTPTYGGGLPAYTFSIGAGTLPAGLSLNTSTGAVSGTPTTAATSSGITIHMVDSASGAVDLTGLSITISAAGASTAGQPRGLSLLLTKAS